MTDLFDPLASAFSLHGSNGEAAILVHGFTGVAAHFRPLGGHLAAAGYTVSAPLLAGHGTTIEDMATTGAEDWIQSVLTGVDATRVDHDRVHLVGLSMGGLISVIIANQTGAATVTTINSPIAFRNKQIYLARFFHPFRPEVRWPETPPPDLDPEVASFSLTYDGFPTRASAHLVSISRRAHRAASKVTARSLVIQSLVDETVDPKSGTQLARALRARLVWLEHSRHNALLDRERDVIHGEVLHHVKGVSDTDTASDMVPRP